MFSPVFVPYCSGDAACVRTQAEGRDMLGRDYCEHGVSPRQGRNRRQFAMQGAHRPRVPGRQFRTGGRRHAGLREHQEPRVVRDHLKAPELLFRLPAGPAVARPALEGAALPRGKAHSPVPEGRDGAQPAARKPAKAERVVLVHQRVPERALLRPRQADCDPGQHEPFGRCSVNRVRLHASANRHAASGGHVARESQRKTLTIPRTDARPQRREDRRQEKSNGSSVGCH